MRIITQALLIAAVLIVMARLLRSQGQRTQALRRIGLLFFAGFAALSILLPDLWNSMAQLVGIGRGSDLILYGLVAAFLSFVVTTYLRLREVEDRYTRLARSIALQRVEGEHAVDGGEGGHGGPAARP